MSNPQDNGNKRDAFRQVLGLADLFFSGRRAFSDRRKRPNIPELHKPMLSRGGQSSPPRNIGHAGPPPDDPLKPPGPGWFICVRDGNRPGWLYVMDSEQREVTRIMWIVARHLRIHDCRWFLPDPEDRDFSLTIARAVMEIAYPHVD